MSPCLLPYIPSFVVLVPSYHPAYSWQWRHNERDGVSNHRRLDCLLNRLFRQRKHQSFASLAFVRGIHRWPMNSPHKGPTTRKMFPWDVIMFRTTSIRSNGSPRRSADGMVHACVKRLISKGHVALVSITDTTIPAPYLLELGYP